MSRPPTPAENFDHGDARRYARGCRCQPCTTAATTLAARNKFLRDTGRGSLVAPTRAANHITRLRAAGMRDLDITAAANVVADVFYRILRSGRPIRRSTEHRILAVPIPTKPAGGSGVHAPARGTVRRARALAANGWPAAELARRSGKHKQFIVVLQNSNEDGCVRQWVADYIRNLYTELEALTPEGEGVAAHIAARTRALATGKGWTPTDYWDPDDFDNPDFQPAVNDDVSRNALAEVRRSEVQHLNSFGVTEDDIAARLNMAVSTVRAIIAELRTGERRDRTPVAA